MPRFEQQKRLILAEWAATLEAWRDGRLAGAGEPDRAMVPWCDRINRIPGLCTLQSCEGHHHDGTIDTAHIWIWLSSEKARWFDRAAPELAARTDIIERVSKLFTEDGKEVALVYFRGKERNLLHHSMGVIYEFFTRSSSRSAP